MLIAALALAAAPISLPANLEQRVEIDGRTFRVAVRGRAVTVADKALITFRTPERRASMREAVRRATGCDIDEAYWEGSKLRGILNCPSAD